MLRRTAQRTPPGAEKLLVLEPQEHLVGDGWLRRQCKVLRIDSRTTAPEETLWFDYDNPDCHPPSDHRDADAFLLALIMDAMREGRRLIVKGNVCETLLSNLTEYQEAWHKWLPHTYGPQPIEVEAARPAGQERTASKFAVCAFSGGVDATFSVWRHHMRRVSWRSQHIRLCSIVHGFDIPLEDPESFEHAARRAEVPLSELEIPLLRIRTNYRQVSRVPWEHSFASALVSTLSHLKHLAGRCLMGSGEPYDSLVVPWGSSPVTDHLLSSAEFSVIHDGASHSRTEKVRELAEWTTGVENLRVCWEGTQKDRNCGHCEKCLRTMLNFLVCGQPIPRCFPGHIDIARQLSSVRLKNDAVRAEWNQILMFAERHRIRADWIKALRKVLRRGYLGFLRPKAA